jgi:hypothetical protein
LFTCARNALQNFPRIKGISFLTTHSTTTKDGTKSFQKQQPITMEAFRMTRVIPFAEYCEGVAI